MPLLVAASPLLVSTLLILAFRQSALRAGLAGLALAALAALLAPDFRLAPAALWHAFAHGLLTTLTVAYVLLGGVALYWVLRAGGALETLGRAAADKIPDAGQRVLVLVLGVSVFFESATGFGVGIIVTVPLLLALGYGPERAALLALLGQCAVPWGALAIGTVLGAKLSGVPAEDMGTLGVWLSLPFILLCGALALWLAEGAKAVLAKAGWLLLYTAVLCATLWAASAWISVELSGCFAGLAVTAAGLFAGRLGGRRSLSGRTGDLARAAVPLALLLAALTLTRLVDALKGVTEGLLVLRAPDYGFVLPVVHHPGFWMLAAAALGIVALRIPAAEVRLTVPKAAKQWWIASLSVAGFICFGHVMLYAGMTEALAKAVADAAGTAYLYALPLVGGLGGFLTASNAGSNAVFMQFQASVAERLGLDQALVAATQNAAGANTTLASPGRIVLAAAVSGLAGQENRLMRPALAVAAAGLVAMSAVLTLL